jgi:hypothetical protein
MPYFDEPVEEWIDHAFKEYVPPAFPEAVRKSGNPESVAFKKNA